MEENSLPGRTRKCKSCKQVRPVEMFPKKLGICEVCANNRRQREAKRLERIERIKEEQAFINANTFRVCAQCGVRKPIDEYVGGGARSKHLLCRACERDNRQAQKEKAQEEQRDILLSMPWRQRTEYVYEQEYYRRIKHMYGITEARYKWMREEQNEKCAICGLSEDEIGERLFVDHDHRTGAVRGLLCRLCNHGLGCFRDNPALLSNAAKYLQKLIWEIS